MRTGLILNKFRKAQSVLEYALIVAAVSAAFIAMRPYVQRTVQSVVKSVDTIFSPKPN